MPIAERSASTDWEGDLAHGRGAARLDSGAVDSFEVTWASRTGRSDGKTSPEELIAGAHASCFAMELSRGLTGSGHVPERLNVKARVALDQRDGVPTITTSELTVTGRVPGIDQAEFERAAADAGKDCPVSRALASVKTSVQATLE
jgi:osmotically inducible protein OsmC